ncbi:MAG: undecaprenyldiphospho-muramoylpentapeptide beta-N-acetylglucosaminyltransferase [Eubacteriales bacterium]|nr:undecaprenyldiphospho-muramoylpentapeptide beta-N-acetylglucosaminyltransferase [Eubacteriales bacterium]
MKALKVVIAGGGTSGHINPALAIADQIRLDHPDAEIRFVGTARGLESQLVPKAGYDFTPIRARGLPNRINKAFFAAVADFFAGKAQSRRLLKDFRPDAVVGTGGYVCSPLVAAAASLKIPVLLHEQNAYPGRSNRLLAHRSSVVCISMPGAERYFRTKAPIVLTGNPVRSIFFQLDQAAARASLGWNSGTRILLATGGSLGAQRINETILALQKEPVFQKLLQEQTVEVHLACGQQQYEAVQAAAHGLDWLHVHDYLHEMPQYLAGADLVLSRAGAMTCAELAALGKPSILVPYPFAAGDHQTANANVHEQTGAAIRIANSDLNAAWLSDQLETLFNQPGRLAQMSNQAHLLAMPDAAAKICRSLYATIQT